MKGVIYIITTHDPHQYEGRQFYPSTVAATAWTAEDAKIKAVQNVRHWNEVHIFRWSIPNQVWDKHWALNWNDAQRVIEEIE